MYSLLNSRASLRRNEEWMSTGFRCFFVFCERRLKLRALDFSRAPQRPCSKRFSETHELAKCRAPQLEWIVTLLEALRGAAAEMALRYRCERSLRSERKAVLGWGTSRVGVDTSFVTPSLKRSVGPSARSHPLLILIPLAVAFDTTRSSCPRSTTRRCRSR